MSPTKKTEGFSAEEKAAMRARAKELKLAAEGEEAITAALKLPNQLAHAVDVPLGLGNVALGLLQALLQPHPVQITEHRPRFVFWWHLRDHAPRVSICSVRLLGKCKYRPREVSPPKPSDSCSALV